MARPIKKPWQHPPIRSPATGEAGKWESTQGRDIFTPIGEMDAAQVGDEELERWLHPRPTFRSADSEPEEEIEGVEEEIQKQPPGTKRIVPESSRTTPGQESKPSIFGDPVENLNSNVGKEQGYGNLDLAFTQGRGENDIGGQDSETYIGSQTSNNKRKTDMNKITHTKVGDDIHFYVNGKEDRGVVVKMGSSYIQVFKEDGNVHDIHINDTFFVKDIVVNKTWDNMDEHERYEALNKIHAPSPRFIMKKWADLPVEIKQLLSKTGWTYEPGTTKDHAETQDHSRTGNQQNTQYDADTKEKREVSGNTEGVGRNARFGQNQEVKSDVELQHDPQGPMLGGVATNEEPLDAEPDYEGQTHDPKAEQFKHKEEGAEHDPATGKKKDGGFDRIYGPPTGEPGTDQKYGDKKSGIAGVPDYNVNTFGINYSSTKQAHPPKKEDKDGKEEE